MCNRIFSAHSDIFPAEKNSLPRLFQDNTLSIVCKVDIRNPLHLLIINHYQLYKIFNVFIPQNVLIFLNIIMGILL